MRRKNLDHNLIQGYIEEALFKLMENKDFVKISVGEIAEVAGVHRATFYRHFSSKEDIIEQYLANLLTSSQDQALLKTNFKAYILPVFQALYDHKREMLLIHHAHLSTLLCHVLEDYFDFHELSLPTKQQSPLNKEDYAMAYRIGGIYFCLVLWLSHNMQETPEEMAQMAASL